MSKIHPQEETYPLQRRFSAAKVRRISDICKKNKYFSQKKAERVLCFLTSDG